MGARTKPVTLLDAHGCVLTSIRETALRILPRLREHLDCDGVSIRKCEQIKGDHEWCEFVLAPKFHAIARTYIAAWMQGVSDGLDSHYSRQSYRDYLASKGVVWRIVLHSRSAPT